MQYTVNKYIKFGSGTSVGFRGIVKIILAKYLYISNR